MSILDNKKKLKDTVDGFANSILKYKTSNKPNKFNSSSNEIKKDYKKLTKLRKDLNDLADDGRDDDDKEKQQFVKQISMSVASAIKEYEEVLLENGESIMETSSAGNATSDGVVNGTVSSIDSTKISKKEQRKLMKEKKNQMKMQAKLAQQEAFNNKQIMITERSAKDIVIDIPEPTVDNEQIDNPKEEENTPESKNENDNVRVEHVPKSRKSEEKKKKQQAMKTVLNTVETNSKEELPAPPMSPVAPKFEDLTEKLLNRHKSSQNTTNQQSQQVEWGQLAAQRKQKEIQEKERELQEQEAAQIAAAEAASLLELERQQRVNLANPSVLLAKQLPQLVQPYFQGQKQAEYSCTYDNGLGCEYSVEDQQISVRFSLDNKNNNANTTLGLPGGLESIMNDYLNSKSSFYKRAESNPSLNKTWFDFKSYESVSKTDTNELQSNAVINGANGVDHGIVITGRRNDKDNSNDIDNSENTERETSVIVDCSAQESFIRYFIEQCY